MAEHPYLWNKRPRITRNTPDGWLSPSGEYFNCGHERHGEFIGFMIDDSNGKLTEGDFVGWIAMSSLNGREFSTMEGQAPLTDEQREVLEYMRANGPLRRAAKMALRIYGSAAIPALRGEDAADIPALLCPECNSPNHTPYTAFEREAWVPENDPADEYDWVCDECGHLWKGEGEEGAKREGI